MSLSGKIQFDAPNFNPDNPQIILFGFGTMTYLGLQKNIAGSLEEIAKDLKKTKSDSLIREIAGKKSTLNFKIAALADIEKELNAPATKRKLAQLKKTTNRGR